MTTPTKSRARLIRICACLVITLAFSGFALAQNAGNTQARQNGVVEMINCLGGLLVEENILPPESYLNKLMVTEARQFEEDCATSRVGKYDAEDFASYAMGVSLQEKLLSKHESLNWVDFINGLLRADSSTVRMSSSRIATVLKNTLLGDAEASQKYLDEVSESRGVTEIQGVFIKKLLEATDSRKLSSAEDKAPCAKVRNADDQQLLVKFYLVRPIETDFDINDIFKNKMSCIEYQSDEVIRGWRLIMDKLERQAIYDVLVPSDLAYGATGVQGSVEGDENLRFLMQVIKHD